MLRSSDRLATTLLNPPAVEPVSVSEAKAHLHADGTFEDIYIASLVSTARAYVEETTGRALITQTWQRKLDRFPGQWESSRAIEWDSILLPRPPLQSVTAIRFLDQAGVEQTWATENYRVDTDSVPGRVSLEYNRFYPITREVQNAVTIEYVAGFGPDATDVPPPLRHAIKLLVSQHFEHREPEVTGSTVSRYGFSVDALLSPYKVSWF